MFGFKKNEPQFTANSPVKEQPRVIDLPRTSVVGETVEMFEKNRRTLEKEIESLTTEITDKIERRRQLTVSLGAVTAAQTMLADDKSLTKEQRAVADREVVISLREIKLDEP